MTTDIYREIPAVGEQDTTPVQLLSPQGTRAHHDHYARRVAHLDRDALEGFYRDMALVRRFDREATALQRHGELGLWAPSFGQEAAQVGSAHAIARRDFIFPSYREHGVAHVRGLDLPELLPLYRGVAHGGYDPHAHDFTTASLVIGSHTLHAVGYAMGIQRDGDVGTGDPGRDRAVVTYFGDGATSQGDVNEALVFAASNNAPVVFFVQNNQWAISVPAATQSPAPIAWRGRGFAIPSVRVDGNDVLACYAVTDEALERARSGGGPTFIEAVTYRRGAHTTSDDPTRYRTQEEEARWAERDPIDRLRARLESLGTPAEFFDNVEGLADEFGAHTREHCHALAAPAPETMFDHVYASEHSQVAYEREWFANYQAGFEESA